MFLQAAHVDSDLDLLLAVDLFNGILPQYSDRDGSELEVEVYGPDDYELANRSPFF